MEAALPFSSFESVDGSDVGMIQGCQELGFTFKAGHSLKIICECIGKELQGNLAV
jgi:hypothetical protein